MTPHQDSVKANLSKSLIVAFENCKKNEKLETLTDLYVQLNTHANEVVFYDDEEESLTSCKVALSDLDSEGEESVFDVLVSILRDIIDSLEFEESISEYDLVKPFSLLVVDESFEQQNELFILDPGEIIVEHSILANVDKELDDFLNKLLAE